jgi:hypothetical protein
MRKNDCDFDRPIAQPDRQFNHSFWRCVAHPATRSWDEVDWIPPGPEVLHIGIIGLAQYR